MEKVQAVEKCWVARDVWRRDDGTFEASVSQHLNRIP